MVSKVFAVPAVCRPSQIQAFGSFGISHHRALAKKTPNSLQPELRPNSRHLVQFGERRWVGTCAVRMKKEKKKCPTKLPVISQDFGFDLNQKTCHPV